MYAYYFSYWWLIVPALVLGVVAQSMVRNAYQKYSQVRTGRGATGAEIARRILDENGLTNVQIKRVPGRLTDHYDPRSRTLRLSEGVYGANTVAAAGIAAHEAGHAVQHASSYTPIAIRNTVYPVASFGSKLGPMIVIFGFFFGLGEPFITIGIGLFAFAVAFTVLTLPVEFNASSRALRMLGADGHLRAAELEGAKRVLNAAAMTYVASALASVLTLVRLILIGRRG